MNGNPNTTERLLNRLLGFLLKAGVGPRYMYLLEVRGRRSGDIHTTPVDLMSFQGRDYLVAPGGETSWVRNARAAKRVALARGRERISCTVDEVPDSEKPVLLKEYLRSHQRAVQQFFPIPAESPTGEFAAIASRYPVFQIRREPVPAA